MDRNNIIGFVLIALVLIGFSWWQQPSAEEQRAAFVKDSLAQVNKKKAEQQRLAEMAAAKANAAQEKADTTRAFYQARTGRIGNVVLKNDHVELTFSTKGATVEKAVIKNFEDLNGEPNLLLFAGKDQTMNFILPTTSGTLGTQELNFTPSSVTDSTVTFTAADGKGGAILMNYRLGNDYLLHLDFQTKGMASILAPGATDMAVDWQERCRQTEQGFTFENRHSTLTYKENDGGTHYLSEQNEELDKVMEAPLDWVAFKNQFFSAVLIAKDNFKSGASLSSIPQEKGSGYLKQYSAKLKTSFDPTGSRASQFELYFGPNDFRLLQRVEKQSSFNKDLELSQLVYLGWPLVRIINRWFTIYVFDFLTGLNINMGIVLILITLLLKLITFPLVKKSYMGSAKMRVLKPKLDKATAQFNGPDEQMKKQQAMMAEYAKYGVSPLSGCLPMLIQAPIWIAMFNFVPNAIQLRRESFLWIDDLSTYDPIITWGHNIWLIGDHLSLTCILFCVANVLYSMMTMRQQRDQMVGQQAEQMKMMQWMMYLMPVMFFFMFNDYSAGLNFYYFVSLFFSAAIMWTLRKTTNDEKLLAKLEARYEENKKNPQKMSGLAARLQAMQQQQEELRKKQEELNRKKNKL